MATDNIPASAREFERWMADVAHEWTPELRIAGERALLTLHSLDQPQAAQSPAFMEASRKDLLAVAMAYGAWAASKG
jgi:hypothetical protein